MMRSLLVIVLGLLLYSCDNKTKRYEVIVIEECEYVFYKRSGYNGQAIAHKGNCKNPIHIYK